MKTMKEIIDELIEAKNEYIKLLEDKIERLELELKNKSNG